MSALPPTPAIKAMTLAGVMRAVPPLLDACIWSWQPHWGVGIRILRLVCKDMPSVALGAIQSFSAQVGNGAIPNPYQMAKIMRHSLPLQLDLTVIVKASKGEWCCLLVGFTCLHQNRHDTKHQAWMDGWMGGCHFCQHVQLSHLERSLIKVGRLVRM